VLELMGRPPHTARRQARRFRRHSIELLHQMAPLQGDEQALIAAAKQGRAQLEQLWLRERAERRAEASAAAKAPAASHPEAPAPSPPPPPAPAQPA
jgi:glutathione-regulated potassium-efflux system ancillary protein KefC